MHYCRCCGLRRLIFLRDVRNSLRESTGVDAVYHFALLGKPAVAPAYLPRAIGFRPCRASEAAQWGSAERKLDQHFVRSPERARSDSPGQGDAERKRSIAAALGDGVREFIGRASDVPFDQALPRPKRGDVGDVCFGLGDAGNEIGVNRSAEEMRAVVTQGCVRRGRTCPGLSDFALAGLRRRNDKGLNPHSQSASPTVYQAACRGC